jgi:hypothetical protein
MFGDITVKCRPLRLAFLIPPDKTALRKAIQVNSTLWGGTYNPIIPLYAQVPKTWRMYPGQKVVMKDRVPGYFRAFDPDVLVDGTGGKLPPYVADLGRPTISIDNIWSDFLSDKQDGAPQYGVGVFELLSGIFKEYFEVVHRFPSKVAFPVIPKEHALFWAATVGELLAPIQEAVEAGYSEALDIEKPAIGPQNYEPILQTYRFLPRDISRYDNFANRLWAQAKVIKVAHKTCFNQIQKPEHGSAIYGGQLPMNDRVSITVGRSVDPGPDFVGIL